MIKENFRKVGVFNLALLVLVIIYDSIRLATGHSLIPKIAIIVHFVAYFAGILYTFRGYKKGAAKYYKVYMFLVAISETLSFIVKLTRSEVTQINTVLSGVCVAIALSLTFIKDLGNKLSISLCSLSLAIHLYNLIYVVLFSSTKFQAISGPISDLALIAITFVFVLVKYEDKAARGSE